MRTPGAPNAEESYPVMWISRPDLRNTLIAVCLVLVACLLTEPYAEIGVNDDWSYVQSSRDLAATGKILYNGWAAAMLGAQLYWGALFALVFGDSYTAVRLSCVPLALISVFLCYATFRRSNIEPTSALLGSLTMGLSPMFLPHAVTFMSEMPCTVLFLATVYAFARADGARAAGDDPANRRAYLIWIGIATVLGVIGGTVRQINWILAALGPVLVVVRARRSGAAATTRAVQNQSLAACTLALVTILLSTALGNAWFARQPYAVLEQVDVALPEFFTRVFNNWGFVGDLSYEVAYTLIVLALPAVPLAHRLIWNMTPRQRVLGSVAAGVFILIQWYLKQTPPYQRFPWMDSTVAPWGIWWGLIQEQITKRPRHFPVPWSTALSVLVVVVTSLVAANAAYISATRKTVLREMPFALLLNAVFMAVYLPLLWVKTCVPLSFGVFDRYLLPVLPGVILGLLYFGQHGDEKPTRFASRMGYAISGLFVSAWGYFAVMTTSDLFLEYNAARIVAGRLEKAGIDRTLINGGMSYNAATQIAITGHYNDPRIKNPPDSYREPRQYRDQQIRFGEYTPDVKGYLYLTFDRSSSWYDVEIAPFVVQSRFSNRRRYLYVQSSVPEFEGMTLDEIVERIAKAKNKTAPEIKLLPGSAREQRP